MASMPRGDLLKTIERYQGSIQLVNPVENDPQRVLHYIRKLSKLPIKLDELEKTGIGKTINALRKCQGTVGDEASLLVGKWKAIAKKQVQEEEESSRKRSDADSHSDYESPGSEHKSSVSKSSKKIKSDVEKVQSEKSVKEIKLKSSKDKVHSSKDSTNDRKRKHSLDKDKHEKKEKYVKLEPPSESDGENYADEPRVKKETVRKSIKVEDKHRHNDRKSKKDKSDEEKVAKKEHEKKHKSSKHKEEKNHHKHHSSKSSHTEKKRDSKSDSEKHRDRDKKKDSSKSTNSHSNERKSSSNSRKESKSSSKYSSNGPSANRIDNRSSDSDNNVDFPATNTDDDFGAALLGISVSPIKKKSTPSKYSSSIQSSPASPTNSGSEFDVLSNSVKLEPLDDIDLDKLKEDHYKSKEDMIRERSNLRLKEISEEEALNSMTTTKNQRTKVFSGCKSRVSVKLPSLFDLCVRILQDNFDGLEYTGGVPFDVLKPILEKVNAEQLYTFENYNPYLIGETDELWEYHVKRHFRNAKRQELETWRDVYLRCVEEREEKLQSLTENISLSIANSAPVRKTKLAYLDTHVKPPRNVARSQAKHGTAHNISVKRSPKGPQPSAAAVQSVKERLAQESLAAPQALTLASSRNQIVKKKKAPLMQKSLQLLKGLKR